MLSETRGDVPFAELKSLIVEISRMDIMEFELEYRDIRIVLRKHGNGSNKLLPGPILSAKAPVSGNADSTRPINSPLTGVFYLSPSPTAPAFVQEGDVIEEGHLIGMVEAMKVFNEIRAEWSGKVVRIHARSGELVQTGQVLMELTPVS
ncbi:MAG: acetyl-CoA carboxylase [Dehalococcoidia bacterium]|nr:acetyl-CoA carboxylase [Dehalococcoidia bacterium]